MNLKLKEKILESLSAVLPITGIVFLISIIIVPMELGTMVMFLSGAVFLVFGMGFFQLGAEMAMTPLGEGIGVCISKTKKISLIVLTGFFMGAMITVSEPDLQVLAEQVPSVPNIILVVTVAVGVGVFLTAAILRILFQINLSTILIVLYALLIITSRFIPAGFLAVAFDSGGVTTGPMTVPFIMAMGVGLALVRSDKNAAGDSFGLVALSSVGPILTVLILGLFYSTDNVSYTPQSAPSVATTRDVVREFVFGMPEYIEEVFISLLPIVAVFIAFQLFGRMFQRSQHRRITIGFFYTFIGLVLFLCGVNVGFAPIGTYIGGAVAAERKWLLVPIGMLIGYYIVKAEPAIRVLNYQVADVTNDAVSAASMNRCLSVGVSVSVGLAMLRLLCGIPIEYIIVPGYVAALVLSRMVPKIFVGIAFDSGGVASGPMTTTFLLPLSIGACIALGGNIMTDAFGVVALVALTPLIAVQIMGLVYKFKTAKMEKSIVPDTGADAADEIFDFGEDDHSEE